MNLKRFVVFAFNASHPLGGLNDIKCSFDTFHEVQGFLRRDPKKTVQIRWDSVHILDLEEPGKVWYLKINDKGEYDFPG